MITIQIPNSLVVFLSIFIVADIVATAIKLYLFFKVRQQEKKKIMLMSEKIKNAINKTRNQFVWGICPYCEVGAIFKEIPGNIKCHLCDMTTPAEDWRHKAMGGD